MITLYLARDNVWGGVGHDDEWYDGGGNGTIYLSTGLEFRQPTLRCSAAEVDFVWVRYFLVGINGQLASGSWCGRCGLAFFPSRLYEYVARCTLVTPEQAGLSGAIRS